MGDPKADIVTMHIVVRKHVSKKDPGNPSNTSHARSPATAFSKYK